ncbi:hypothetical protein ACFTWF_21020 [Rhodococcus sp. NPDC056960]|uniref:hypothetical protein n=1 Tax=Rhodococcus sp. NPDC056960 TaxID=3345982 RepID=UPI003636FA9F
MAARPPHQPHTRLDLEIHLHRCARHGVEHPLGPDFTGAQDLLPHTIDETTALDYAERVPPSLVQILRGTKRLRGEPLAGTPDVVAAHLPDAADTLTEDGQRASMLL